MDLDFGIVSEKKIALIAELHKVYRPGATQKGENTILYQINMVAYLYRTNLHAVCTE